ncbi:MAG: radical SAM protein [Atribacterota bacterium]|jgi:putative pyruvate formate lyase activating enzyme|nr:radical SAM protein [Atribacterota bacterium]MDD5637998.1 radical SAM protein [Atribacterota bacterium]
MRKYPSYLNISEVQFRRRIKDAYQILQSCRICPHHCGVNRIAGEKGLCRSTAQVMVSSHNVHFGEEPPISRINGSGTIFFTNCTLRCIFCQNYPISQLGNGNPISIYQLSSIMLDLQKKGCHNINLVTPTHFVPQIIAAIGKSRKRGLSIPIVYNSSGYESLTTLKLLEGIIDIYLPDAKYADNFIAWKYSRAKNYVSVLKDALREMYRQVGNLKVDQNGVAVSGLIIRHLVLPNNLAGTDQILPWIAKNISQEIYISLMSQYFPTFKAMNYPQLSCGISRKEYQKAKVIFEQCGLKNGWLQQ